MKNLKFELNIQIKLFLKITIFRINHKINNIAHAFAKVNEAQQIILRFYRFHELFSFMT